MQRTHRRVLELPELAASHGAGIATSAHRLHGHGSAGLLLSAVHPPNGRQPAMEIAKRDIMAKRLTA